MSSSYRKASKILAESAVRSKVKTVAVLTFSATRRGDEPGAMAVSERLISQLVQDGKVQVVERTLLRRVLDEQGLGGSGLLDPNQAGEIGRILGVEAIVTGTLMPTGEEEFEANARIIDARTARIIGAAVITMTRDWPRTDAPADWKGWDVPKPPLIDGELGVWWQKNAYIVPVTGCKDWEGAVDGLQSDGIDLKARYWAARMLEPGFSRASIQRNPGSEIRNMQLRYRFYERLKEYHESGVEPLGAVESEHLARLETSSRELVERCAGE
jgi:hypothetical protein